MGLIQFKESESRYVGSEIGRYITARTCVDLCIGPCKDMPLALSRARGVGRSVNIWHGRMDGGEKMTATAGLQTALIRRHMYRHIHVQYLFMYVDI
jgi:hypothetical protein